MDRQLAKNEMFLFDRQFGGELRVLNCFPNTYEVGMASLGYQNVFKLFASNPKTHATRYFTDWNEDFSKEIDLISFSISWELDFINVVKILRELNIPLKSSERDSSHPLIFAGGPVLTANPEPWVDFFDLIAIGDAEDNIPQLIDILSSQELGSDQQHSHAARIARLEPCLEVPGIYIPELYDADLQFRIERQKSKPEKFASSSVIAPESCWDDVFLLEVERSCPEMCRFCLASYLTLPFRTPDLEGDLTPKVKEGLKYSKNLGLLGPSVTQHPEFVDLLRFLLKVKQGEVQIAGSELENQDSDSASLYQDLKVQVASMRATTITPELCDLLVQLGVESLTIAVESGSEKLRELINKKLPQEAIFASAKYAQEAGMKSIKFYGMVGLPHETDEDIDATINMLLGLRDSLDKETKSSKEGGKKQAFKLVYGCSVFTPKAQTPFQDYGVDPSSESKLKKIEKAVKSHGIDFRAESYKWAQIQALVSRGDRTINDLMISVANSNNTGFGIYKKLLDKASYKHFVFDDWSEIISGNTYKYPWHFLVSDKQQEILFAHKAESQELLLR